MQSKEIEWQEFEPRIILFEKQTEVPYEDYLDEEIRHIYEEGF